ncbi:MAG: M23 family metallopeptidase [Mailhella sp.]|nr:M23 family metallopeptidase [Mailhella sp.]
MLKRRSPYRSSGRRSSGISVFAIVMLSVAAAAGGWFLLKDMTAPAVTFDHSGNVGVSQPLSITLEDQAGIRYAKATVRRGDHSEVVYENKFPVLEGRRDITVDLKPLKMPEGPFELEIEARDGSFALFGYGNSGKKVLKLSLDSQAPRITVRTMPPNIRRGGSALVSYTVSEDVSSSGVKVGSLYFPGYRMASGAYACLFPYPLSFTSADYRPEITATDLAGNVTTSRLPVRLANRVYKADTLNIPDSFLNFKAPELAQLCPEKDTPLDQYLCSNNKVRASNDETLLKFAADPANVSTSFLWSGTFRRLPRSAVKAGFGDFRTYVDGARQKIDEQTHMGLDLASVAKAEIPASQAGRVVWVDYLGIHGNMVLIDHGLGLMTQYSHLSEYSVKVGDEVTAGQTVGRTGTSGLAGGDHLHCGVLVGGVPVQPLEWLDPHWVKDNITSRLDNTQR